MGSGDEDWISSMRSFLSAEDGRCAGLDRLPRHVPLEWRCYPVEWLQGYDEGWRQYNAEVCKMDKPTMQLAQVPFKNASSSVDDEPLSSDPLLQRHY